ncbi:MAG TPA: hypothetical protein PKJ45_08445 [Rubrivivax sp.]|nr:hypothetical protein [Rubrivivax sp.]
MTDDELNLKLVRAHLRLAELKAEGVYPEWRDGALYPPRDAELTQAQLGCLVDCWPAAAALVLIDRARESSRRAATSGPMRRAR